jgi:hypothetical protein
MKNNESGSGIGPVVIITVVLVGILIVLKYLIG